MAIADTQTGLSNSLTDLMTSLAVIFILLLCASLNNAQQEGESVRGAIVVDLQKELQAFFKEGVEVKKDENDPLGLIILVPEGLLQFRLDKWIIPERGVEFLKGFIPQLAKTMVTFQKDINSIVVEGHTDMSGTDEHNLELSQKRSMTVVMESLNALKDKDGARACFLELLSASGRGKMEPFIDNATKQPDSDKSRRVIFKIRVRSFEEKYEGKKPRYLPVGDTLKAF